MQGEYGGDNYGRFMLSIRDVEYLPDGQDFVYLSLDESQGAGLGLLSCLERARIFVVLFSCPGNSMDDPLEIETAPCTVFGTTAMSFTNTHQLGEGPDVFFRYTPEEVTGCASACFAHLVPPVCLSVCLSFILFLDFPSLSFAWPGRIAQTVIANISTCGSKFDTTIGLFADGKPIGFNDDDTVMVGGTAVFFCDQSDGTTQSALQNVVLSKHQTYIIAVVRPACAFSVFFSLKKNDKTKTSTPAGRIRCQVIRAV